MLRFLILALSLVPAAPVLIPAAAQDSRYQMSQATDVVVDSTSRTESEEDASSFAPMQEEIIADHHAVCSPFVESLWERHVVLPTPPLFPTDLVDLFRPPQGTRA